MATRHNPAININNPIYSTKAGGEAMESEELPENNLGEIQTSSQNPGHVYILYYRHGMNPQCQKGFIFNGDLKAAVDRAKQHCQKMGYRYIFVRPLVANLEDDEKYKDQYGAVI